MASINQAFILPLNQITTKNKKLKPEDKIQKNCPGCKKPTIISKLSDCYFVSCPRSGTDQCPYTCWNQRIPLVEKQKSELLCN